MDNELTNSEGCTRPDTPGSSNKSNNSPKSENKNQQSPESSAQVTDGSGNTGNQPQNKNQKSPESSNQQSPSNQPSYLPTQEQSSSSPPPIKKRIDDRFTSEILNNPNPASTYSFHLTPSTLLKGTELCNPAHNCLNPSTTPNTAPNTTKCNSYINENKNDIIYMNNNNILFISNPDKNIYETGEDDDICNGICNENDMGSCSINRVVNRGVNKDGNRDINRDSNSPTSIVNNLSNNNPQPIREVLGDMIDGVSVLDDIHMKEHGGDIQKIILEEINRNNNIEEMLIMNLIRGGKLMITYKGENMFYIFRNKELINNGMNDINNTSNNMNEITKTSINKSNPSDLALPMKQETYDIEKGDLVMVCNRGVTDNLFKEEIIEIINNNNIENIINNIKDRINKKINNNNNTPYGNNIKNRIINNIPKGINLLKMKLNNCEILLNKVIGSTDSKDKDTDCKDINKEINNISDGIIENVIVEYKGLIEDGCKYISRIEKEEEKSKYGRDTDISIVIGVIE
eukprot:GHVP01054381.1.p1 GENE.GHVP01054381.1~~GHVP01054381.1.p1  ORF type:complete len:568 (-),score=67.14 GHVP01054381.1:166-1710(-)